MDRDEVTAYLAKLSPTERAKVLRESGQAERAELARRREAASEFYDKHLSSYATGDSSMRIEPLG